MDSDGHAAKHQLIDNPFGNKYWKRVIMVNYIVVGGLGPPYFGLPLYSKTVSLVKRHYCFHSLFVGLKGVIS